MSRFHCSKVIFCYAVFRQVWAEFSRICGDDRRDSARKSLGRVFTAMKTRFSTSDGELNLPLTHYMSFWTHICTFLLQL